MNRLINVVSYWVLLCVIFLRIHHYGIIITGSTSNTGISIYNSMISCSSWKYSTSNAGRKIVIGTRQS